jgi:Fe-S oxidoreductase
VLFNDTFNTYNDPHIAIAATEVLEAIGYEVVLPGHNCCGRPALSKGLVREAREFARKTLNKLSPLVDDGLIVVGLEPSCLSAIRDDYFALLPEDPRVAEVAAATISFEEFIADLAAAGELNGVFKRDPQKVLLHGHCHQKALIGTGPSHATLAAAGCAVNEVDSGCCGMAGSFGYEAEHVKVSLAMAERRLLPAVRSADSDTTIVAAGTSCREQIRQGTGKRALHSAEILRNALVD